MAAVTRLAGQSKHRINGALTATPPDQHLSHHDRNPDAGDAEQIDQHKGAATVFTGDVGELPDIPQPHGRAGRC